MNCMQCGNELSSGDAPNSTLCCRCLQKRQFAAAAAAFDGNVAQGAVAPNLSMMNIFGQMETKPRPPSKPFTTWLSLREAISRLETVEYRLRHGAYMGMRFKFLRREYEADIIVNEVLPEMKRLLTEQNVIVLNPYPERPV